MRYGLAQIVVFASACLLGGRSQVKAQATDSIASCLTPTDSIVSKPGPEISIAEIAFLGSLQMPVPEQEQLADLIKHQSTGSSLDGVTEEALVRVRTWWQDHGYFKVQATGETRMLTSDSIGHPIALAIHVDEGEQYRLDKVTFEHNQAVQNVAVLRALFPIKDGDIFSRDKIAKGLENLRKAYGELGYINFTPIPNTTFDDEKKLISLNIDVDEGKQFLVNRLEIQGVDELSRQEILRGFPIGQIYNQRLFELFLKKHPTIFKFRSDDPAHIVRRLDERAGTVAITLDARPCPAQ